MKRSVDRITEPAPQISPLAGLDLLGDHPGAISIRPEKPAVESMDGEAAARALRAPSEAAVLFVFVDLALLYQAESRELELRAEAQRLSPVPPDGDLHVLTVGIEARPFTTGE